MVNSFVIGAMGETRFRTRRQWHNTLMVVWMSPFAVLIGLIVAASTGRFATLIALLALLAIGLGVALYRDMSGRSTYRINGEKLSLISRSDRLDIPFEEIADASLIDRAGAREYIRQRSLIHTKGWRDLRRRARAFTRFCTVDIGLTSFTLGLGRTVIDRLPNARHDLVLLRLRNGDDLLLSPQYNQDLVDSLSRRLSERK